MPMRSVPRLPCANCCKRCSASSSCGSTWLARASRSRPACVSRSWRPSRRQISSPSCASSFLMEWLSADWVRARLSAAAVSEPCFSTSLTTTRWTRSSMLDEQYSWKPENKAMVFTDGGCQAPGNPVFAPIRLEQADPEIFSAISAENQRQEQHIELIASENYTSPAVMAAQGSQLTNKYAEGYPGKRYYGGCEYVDVAEQLAIDRVRQLF